MGFSPARFAVYKTAQLQRPSIAYKLERDHARKPTQAFALVVTGAHMRPYSLLAAGFIFGTSLLLAQIASTVSPTGSQLQVSVPRLIKFSGTVINLDGQPRTFNIIAQQR